MDGCKPPAAECGQDRAFLWCSSRLRMHQLQVSETSSSTLCQLCVTSQFGLIAACQCRRIKNTNVASLCFAVLRQLKPNTHHRRRRDSTVELSRIGGVRTKFATSWRQS